MLDFAAKDGFTRYPMLDNVIQPDVVTTGNKFLPSVLNGSMTPGAALAEHADHLRPAPAHQPRHELPVVVVADRPGAGAAAAAPGPAGRTGPGER